MSLPGLSHEQDTASSRLGTRNGNHLPLPKQIRFISHDGRPYAKRRRVSTACQTCRKRKTRCSGERPECSTCTEDGHSCGGYGDSVQVRKTLPDDNTNDENMVGEDAVDLKPSNSNGDRYVPALHVSSAGCNSSPGDASRRGDWGSLSSGCTTNSIVSTRNRVPYFRYFGPTAIVPGFKQMVVQIRDHRRGVNSTGESPGQYPTSSRLGSYSYSRCRTILKAFYGLLFSFGVCQFNIIAASISITSFHTCTPLPHFAQRAPLTMILAILISSIPFQAPTVLAVLPLLSLVVIAHQSTYLFTMRPPLSPSHQ